MVVANSEDHISFCQSTFQPSPVPSTQQMKAMHLDQLDYIFRLPTIMYDENVQSRTKPNMQHLLVFFDEPSIQRVVHENISTLVACSGIMQAEKICKGSELGSSSLSLFPENPPFPEQNLAPFPLQPSDDSQRLAVKEKPRRR